jgi:hypothetical protein
LKTGLSPAPSLERTGKLPALLCLHQTIRIGKEEPAELGTNENLSGFS